MSNFVDVLSRLDRGRALPAIEDALAQLAQAVSAHQKKGKMTIEIAVSPSKMEDAILLLDVDVKTSMPRPKRKASLFYADGQGGLHRDDPKQIPMFTPESIETVNRETGEVVINATRNNDL